MKKLGLGVLFLFFIISHLWWLGRFPIGMNHDELEYTLSAKTYFLTGSDLSGSKFPKSIFETKTEGIISFLPAIILSPYFGLVPINQLTVRLPYLLINFGTAAGLYYLVKKMFKDKTLATIASGLFLINPWSFYLSRAAVDSPFSLLFFILGILFLIDDNVKKQWLSLIFFLLGFLSYHGAKVIFLPLILAGLLYKLIKKKTDLKRVGLILVVSLGVVVGYFGVAEKFFNESVNRTRSADIWMLDKDLLSEKVNIERRQVLENNVEQLFSNKATVIIKIFFEKYLTALGPEVLFNFGDPRGTYRFGDHGLFYLIDLVFMILGLINLFKKHPKETYFLLGLVLISPLATAVSGVETSVLNRSFLLMPILIIFVSYGILSAYKLLGRVGMGLILVIYLISFLNFSYFYFFRFPIIGQENYFFSQRLIANYIERSGDKKILVVSQEPREIFLETVFYSQKNQSENLKNFVKNQELILSNVSFVSECPKFLDKETIYIIEKSKGCPVNSGESIKSINEEQFGGPLYVVEQDSLCSDFKLQPWQRYRMKENYLVEKLNNKDFCENWIRQSLQN